MTRALVPDLSAIEVEPLQVWQFGDDGHVFVVCGGFLEGKIGELPKVGEKLQSAGLEAGPVEHYLDHLALFMEQPAAKRFDLLLRAVELGKGKYCGDKKRRETKETQRHA